MQAAIADRRSRPVRFRTRRNSSFGSGVEPDIRGETTNMRAAAFAGLLAVIAATSSAHAADIAKGKETAEMCAGCHGDNGISQTENIPSLAGQPDQFIQWQLVFFRAGTRKNEQMQPIVEQ